MLNTPDTDWYCPTGTTGEYLPYAMAMLADLHIAIANGSTNRQTNQPWDNNSDSPNLGAPVAIDKMTFGEAGDCSTC